MASLHEISDLDAWISILMECKQLPEPEVKKLCDKVRFNLY